MHFRAERKRFRGEQCVEGVDVDLGALEFRPGVFQMVGSIGAPDDIDGQATLCLEPRERLERRVRQHAAKIKDHSLDRQDPALVNSFPRALACAIGKGQSEAIPPPSPMSTPKRVPMKSLVTLITAALLLATPAYAIVGGGTPQVDGVARAVVTIVGSRGNFCTGTLVAPKLVLTVAHCVQPGADYKIVDRGTDGQPQLLNVRTVAIHPNFNMQ